MDEQLLTLSGLKFQQLEQPRWWWYLVGLYQDEISRQGYEKREWLFWQVQRGRSKENTLKKGKSTLCFPDERRVLLHIYLIMETDHPGKGCPG